MNHENRKHQPLLQDPRGWFHRLFLNEALLAGLLLLCFIGVAYTNFASARSYRYWMWLVPVFALAAMISEWSRYKRHAIDGYRYVTQQVLHWGAVFVAIKIVFMLHQIGRFNNDVTALALMLIMSLATFLAGVYIGWRFMALGLFIGLAAVLVASLEAYIWVLIPVAMAIVATGVVVAWWEFRKLARS